MSITTRINLLLTSVVAIAAIAVTLVVFAALHGVLLATEESDLRDAASRYEVGLRVRLDSARDDARFLSAAPAVQRLIAGVVAGRVDPRDPDSRTELAGYAESLFAELMRANGEYVQARLIAFAGDGPEMVRIDRQDDGRLQPVPAAQLQAKGNRDYVQATRELPDGVEQHVSRIDLNQEFGRIVEPHQPMLRVTHRVRTADGQPFGLVALNIDPRRLLADATPAKNGITIHVVDGDGRLLLDPDPARSWQLAPGQEAAGYSDFPALLAEDTPRDEASFRRSPQGDYIALPTSYGAELSQHRLWIVARGRPGTLSPVTLAVIGRAFGVGLLLLLLTIAAGVWFSQRLMRPVRELTSAVEDQVDSHAQLNLPARLTGEARLLGNAIAESHDRLLAEHEALVRSSRELDAVARIAAHDLQEPLKTITDQTQLLRERCGEGLGEQGERHLQALAAATERIRKLVRDVLDFSSIGQRRRREAVRLDALLEQVLEDLKAPIRDRGARVTVGPMPALVADPALLHQLFHHLIANAIHHRAPDRSPRVEVSATPLDGGDTWRFEVSDNGIGIPEEHREHVFEAFRRADAPASLGANGTRNGTGIGLANCRKIVEHHGGRIRIVRSPVEGTVVQFELRSRDDEESV